MKKKLVFIFLLLHSMISYGQVIIFSISNNVITHNGDLNKLELPAILRFTNDYTGKTISLTTDRDQPLGINKVKFGSDKLPLGRVNGGFYDITINADGTTSPRGKIPDDSFILNIDGHKITIKPIPQDKTKDKLKSEVTIPEPTDPGYITYDALELANSKTDPKRKLEIIKAYGLTKENIDSIAFLSELQDLYQQNITAPQGELAANLLSKFGDVNVTQFAAGLARFLAERTKEELNEAFFSKMKERINLYPELRTVFPKTSAFMNVIETYSYASVIQVLKEAFETDMQNLPENLYEIKNLTTNSCIINGLKDGKKKACEDRIIKLKAFFATKEGYWTGLGLFTIKTAPQISNPAALLQSIAESSEIDELKTKLANDHIYNEFNVAASIELVNLLSFSMRSKEKDEIWVNNLQINNLLREKNALKYYFGLLSAYARLTPKKISFCDARGNATYLEVYLKRFGNGYENYIVNAKDLVQNTYAAFNNANNGVKKILAASEKSFESDPQSLYVYYKTFTAALKPIIKSPLLSNIINPKFSESYDQVINYLDPSLDLVYHIASKKYSAAIYDAVSILNRTDLNDASGKQITAFDRPVVQLFIKYGTLISTVANASSSNEVKKAIEASVLPAGSASIKRNSAWSISINSYVGGFWGEARARQRDSIMEKKSYQTFGLYAPVGISFNRGFKSGWGLSIATQIIDMGALVNFYLLEGDQTALPADFKVRVSNIYAPGAHFALNLPKMPVTVTAGMQYVPSLYEVNQVKQGSEIIGSSAWRTHISLVVDIPLFNIRVWDFSK